jgi:hypothetical protein
MTIVQEKNEFEFIDFATNEISNIIPMLRITEDTSESKVDSYRSGNNFHSNIYNNETIFGCFNNNAHKFIIYDSNRRKTGAFLKICSYNWIEKEVYTGISFSIIGEDVVEPPFALHEKSMRT